MDLFEDLGGCAIVAIIAVILLVIVGCVALILIGGALPDLFG